MSKNALILNLFRRVSALMLALTILVSGSGFSFAAHYCGNELKSWAIYGETAACDMPAVKEVKCPSHEGMIISVPNNCCNDHSFVVDKVDQKAHFIKTEISQPGVIIIQTPVDFSQEFVTSNDEYPSLHSRPPPTDKEIYILVQSFLL